jgi:hypothetical protein
VLQNMIGTCPPKKRRHRRIVAEGQDPRVLQSISGSPSQNFPVSFVVHILTEPPLRP